MFSSPASIRSKVDLPHPEGPTSTTNCPSSIGIDTPCRTSKPPNDFRTSRICTDDIHFLLNTHKPPRQFPRPSCYLAGGLSRLFRRCRCIKVVGVPSPRQRCERDGDMQTSPANTNIKHKKKACAPREKR